jgi:hypothetical protein
MHQELLHYALQDYEVRAVLIEINPRSDEDDKEDKYEAYVSSYCQ